MSGFKVASRKWIVPGHLPLGGVVLVAADTNIGKTALVYGWLASATACEPFATDVPVITKPMKALLFSGEGSRLIDVNPKLIASGCNMDLLKVYDCVGDKRYTKLLLPEIAAIVEESGAKFAVIDPTPKFVNTATTPYHVRQVLQPFQELSELGVTTILVCELTKSGTVSGSMGWIYNSPFVWEMEQMNPNGDAVLEMTKGKVPRPFPRYEFSLDFLPVEGVDDPVPFAVVGDRSSISIADLREMKRPNVKTGGEFDRAVAWFKTYLKNGPMPAAQGIIDATAAKISESTRNRAKDAVPVLSKKEGDVWFWYVESLGKDESLDGAEGSQGSQDSQDSQDSQEACHYTDPKIMAALHEVLGPCYRDPASPAKPVHVQALNWYAIERGEDGLSLPWTIPDDGRSWLWLNGPWNAPKGEPSPFPFWADKLLAEMTCGNVQRSVSLWPYSADTDWFKRLEAAGAARIIITRRGLKFGVAKNGPRERLFALLMFGLRPEEVAAIRAALVRHGVDVVPDPKESEPAKPVPAVEHEPDHTKETAYHEAGHAFLHYHFHIPVESIDVYRPKDFVAESAMGRVSAAQEQFVSRGDRDTILNVMMVCLAGPCAQARFTGTSPDTCGGDAEQVLKLAGLLSEHRHEQGRIIVDCEKRTQELLDAHWGHVEKIANVLISKGHMSGQEMVALLMPKAVVG